MVVALVLVVDDDPVFLYAVSRMLNRNGYEVLQAGSPHQALEIVRDTPPIDLIVSDNQMPGMLGTQLIREIGLRSPQTVYVLMTGAAIEPADAPNATVLKKPFSGPELISAVQATLAQSGHNRSRPANESA